MLLKGRAELLFFCDHSRRLDSRFYTQRHPVISVGQLLFLRKHNQTF